MKRTHRWTWHTPMLFLALLLSLSGCSTETPQRESDSSVPDRTAPTVASASAIDGIVVDGEYARTRTIADVELHWSTDENTLTMAMAAPCTGYVTVGFDPDNRKEGGNYIIGYVKDGIAIVRDHVGTRGNLHDADVNLGGENNIIAFAGSEEDGWTTLEFAIPLDSGDAMDKPLVPGNKHIILVAYQHNRDDLISVHTRHGVAQVEI